ncbi:MAG: hypothetical protein E6F99_03590 [Actinobacteria bacterium]|nr:MAG: hypothetical protein E6F99_03590 [Actinomycetota bacterium]
MIARMWEVRAYPERFTDLLAWVCDVALPEIEADPRHLSSEVLTSTDHRIVVISRWRSGPAPLPDPPKELVARSAHAWDFTPVDR